MTNGTHRNASNNGVRPDTTPMGDRELDLLWDSLPPRVTKELSQPLDPAQVSSRRGRGTAPTPTWRTTSPSPKPTGYSATAAGATRWRET